MAEPPSLGNRALRVVLSGLVIVPALTVTLEARNGRLLFIEYREPKLAAALLVGTVFLALFVSIHGPARSARIASEGLAENPELKPFALLLCLMALSGLWAAVPENWWYEVRQYSLFFAVALLVRWWARRDPSVSDGLVASVCGVTGLLALIGGLQAVGVLPWLVPIDPGYGVGYPSLLGYKNPMALAVVGQLFLLPLLADRVLRSRGASRRRSLLLAAVAALFILECVYVAFLKSRTSYLALGLGLVLGLALTLSRTSITERRPAAPHLGIGLLGAILTLGLLLGLNGDLRDRLLSVKVDYVDSWSESDRVTYLLNSISMARHRPFGVGLGDWQTHYPVYRAYNPEVAFSEAVQPRRAHGDHAQILGELGLPGFVLWAFFWAHLLWRRFRPDRQDDPIRSRWLGVQCFVFLVAMAGDFVLEHPYLKLQFFLALALPAGVSEGSLAAVRGNLPPIARPRHRAVRPGRPLVPVLALAVVSATAWETSKLAVRLRDSSLLRLHYVRIAEARAASRPPEVLRPDVRRALAAGDRFVRGHGHTKTFYKDYLIFAETALLSGRPGLAQDLAWTSLELHPYNSQAFRLLAEIWAPFDADRSGMFQEVHLDILEGPTSGFRRNYPSVKPLPPGDPPARRWFHRPGRPGGRGGRGRRLPGARPGGRGSVRRGGGPRRAPP